MFFGFEMKTEQRKRSAFSYIKPPKKLLMRKLFTYLPKAIIHGIFLFMRL